MDPSATERGPRPAHRLRTTGIVVLLLLHAVLCGCGRSAKAVVRVAPEVLDSYAGDYRPSGDTVVTVTRAGGGLELQVNRQSAMAFAPDSEERFVHAASGTKITFGKDGHGQVTHLVLDRDGKLHEAKRVTGTAASNAAPTVADGGAGFRFRTTGTGGPTVLLWGGIDAWSKVQQEVAPFARVVSFDRTGAAATPKLPDEPVRQLRAALKTSELSPPYVLVGHSFGGASTRVFASLYPADVAGLVLVDPFQEGFVDWLKLHQPANHDRFVGELSRAYVSDWEGTLAALRAARLSPDLPVVLLSAIRRKAQMGNAFEQGISAADLAQGSDAVVASQREWLSHLPHSRHVAVEGGSHDIPGEHPEAVVEAIRRLVEQIRLPRP